MDVDRLCITPLLALSTTNDLGLPYTFSARLIGVALNGRAWRTTQRILLTPIVVLARFTRRRLRARRCLAHAQLGHSRRRAVCATSLLPGGCCMLLSAACHSRFVIGPRRPAAALSVARTARTAQSVGCGRFRVLSLSHARVAALHTTHTSSWSGVRRPRTVPRPGLTPAARGTCRSIAVPLHPPPATTTIPTVPSTTPPPTLLPTTANPFRQSSRVIASLHREPTTMHTI